MLGALQLYEHSGTGESVLWQAKQDLPCGKRPAVLARIGSTSCALQQMGLACPTGCDCASLRQLMQDVPCRDLH